MPSPPFLPHVLSQPLRPTLHNWNGALSFFCSGGYVGRAHLYFPKLDDSLSGGTLATRALVMRAYR